MVWTKRNNVKMERGKREKKIIYQRCKGPIQMDILSDRIFIQIVKYLPSTEMGPSKAIKVCELSMQE